MPPPAVVAPTAAPSPLFEDGLVLRRPVDRLGDGPRDSNGLRRCLFRRPRLDCEPFTASARAADARVGRRKDGDDWSAEDAAISAPANVNFGRCLPPGLTLPNGGDSALGGLGDVEELREGDTVRARRGETCPGRGLAGEPARGSRGLWLLPRRFVFTKCRRVDVLPGATASASESFTLARRRAPFTRDTRRPVRVAGLRAGVVRGLLEAP